MELMNTIYIRRTREEYYGRNWWEGKIRYYCWKS